MSHIKVTWSHKTHQFWHIFFGSNYIIRRDARLSIVAAPLASNNTPYCNLKAKKKKIEKAYYHEFWHYMFEQRRDCEQIRNITL